jgi:signal transduction histidine kinase
VHPIVLIPLASAIIAAALAAAIVAREPARPANRLMAAVLACQTWWALCQVLTLTASEPAAALFYARLETLGCVMMAPFSLHLLVVVLPEPLLPDRRLLTAQYVLATGIALASLAGPWYVPEVARTRFGFAPTIGPLVPWAYLALLSLPGIASLRLVRLSTLQRVSRPNAIPWIEFAIGLTVVVTAITDFALPTLGRHVPRLGSASVALWALATWLWVYRYRGAGLSPRTFANEILATLPDGVALVRLDGRIRAANAKLAQLARQTPEALLGRPLGELIIEPQAAATGSERECELVSASGARVPVSLSDAWLRDADGFAIGRVLVIRDLEELVSLRSRLLTSARLAAVGQLAAGIAHEINNPIAYVRSNVGLLERHWKKLASTFEARAAAPSVGPALARSQELLRTAADGIDRVAAIVRDVGGFSWKGGSENELADPVELLELAVRIAGPQLRRKAGVERSLAKLPLVPCRPQELMQVFLNLVLAGVHAIEQHGQLRLASGVDGAFVWLEIAVAGAGLAPEALDPIFDPFAAPDGGAAQSGIGLAISRQLLERQGGRIFVESRPERGMRFRVSLPLAAVPGEAGV